MCLLKNFNTLFAGVREKSFVYSITSAGVMQAVTRACGRGEIGNCGCDTNVYKRDTKNQFQWGGCSHNPEFGARFAREFVDTKELENNSDSKMNLWNNEAGRQVRSTGVINVLKFCSNLN